MRQRTHDDDDEFGKITVFENIPPSGNLLYVK